MLATAEAAARMIRISDSNEDGPILASTGRTTIVIRAGTAIEIDGKTIRFEDDTPVTADGLEQGCDYGIDIDDNGQPFAARATGNPLTEGFFAGFHVAPIANAAASEGGELGAAINPASLWDLDFRPVCADPRGMALVQTVTRHHFWADIYLLGTDHAANGTSRCGATIADGRDLPDAPDRNGKARKLDYPTAVTIYAAHGKRLLSAEEFFAAAYGVKERCSLEDEPKTTGDTTDDAQRFVSRHGLHGVTGTMWQWGTDGHPDDPRPSIFGGSWIYGSLAGSRYAGLACWPEYSYGSLSARGACDHLIPA